MAHVVKAIGLVTYSNENALEDGSLIKADNVVIDEPNVISPRRGLKDYGNPFQFDETRAKQLLIYKDRLLRHVEDKLEFDFNNAGAFAPFSGSYNEIEEGIRIKYQEANGNLYFTTDDGIKKISARTAAQINTDSIISAGAAKAVDLEGKVEFVSGGFLPPQSKVAYRMLFGYRDNNNNLLLGAPSSRIVLTNASEDIDINEQSTVTINNAPNASDYFILSTDLTRYTVWFDLTGTNPQPNGADTIGTTFVRILLSGASTNTQRANFLANQLATAVQEINVSVSTNVVTIVNKKAENVADIVAGAALTNVVVATAIQGDVLDGDFADTQLTFTLPNEINTTYFYQIYRTAVFEDLENIGLLEIDPGDDMFLVLENPITQADIDNGFITVVDDTPEIFRASGAPLYTSPNIGEGILRANEKPPIAKDIELFRNSTFYANTRTAHKLQVNFLTTKDLISGNSEITIGSKDGFTSYTFVGNQEESRIVVDTRSNTTNGSWILLNSGNDETRYYLLFDTNGSAPIPDPSVYPELAGRRLIKVNLHLYPNSLVGSRDAVIEAIEFLADFEAEASGNNVIITNVNNGSAEDIKIGAIAPGGLWDVTVLSQGDGEGIKKSIEAITTGVTTSFQVTSHGLQTGDKVSFLNTQLDITELNQVYTITLIDNDNFSIAVDTTGEVVVELGQVFQREILISNLPSTSQAIDETARSLVRIINKDPQSVVNAYYLSGPNDLPGIILFESKTLENNTFYIAVNDAALQKSFNPEVALFETITSVTFSNLVNSPAEITASGHGLIDGDEVYVYSPNTTPFIIGSFPVTVVNANSFTIPINITAEDTLSSFAFYYKTTAKSDNSESPNRLYYSKLNQPESVPLLSFIDIGPRDQPIERILALRDNLFILKTDGIYIVTGTTEPNFTARLIDNNSTIIAPDSAVVLNNLIYMLSTQGVVFVNEASPGIISRVIEDKITEVTRPQYDFRRSAFGVAYERDRAYILWLPSLTTDTVATQAFRYNTFERVWTRWTTKATCGLVNMLKDRLYVGAGDRNYILEERKAGNRTDFADRDFTLSIPAGAYEQQTQRLVISSVEELEVGDVIYQDQPLTIAIYNRILRKLDLDPGLESDYELLLKMKAGDDITNKMQDLNNKLVADDSSGTVSAFVASNDLLVLQQQYNDMVDELNLVACDSLYKNYKQETDITPYEALIVKIDRINNRVTLAFDTPFIVGNVTCFKSIKSVIEWNPINFGDPSMLKQIREGTVMFDQNNLYSAFLGYASDLSQNYRDIEFKMAGPGYFGFGTFGGEKFYYGGLGNDAPFRTIIPQDKQRCRYISVRFAHLNAREDYRIVGVSFVMRPLSTRAYR